MNAETVLKICKVISSAVGIDGIIGGQIMDMISSFRAYGLWSLLRGF